MENDRKSYIVGVACTEFLIRNRSLDHVSMVADVVTHALDDCRLNKSDIQAACVRFNCDDRSCCERALAVIGITNIPVTSVRIANDLTVLTLAYRKVKTGTDCVLAVGLEMMLSEPTNHLGPEHGRISDGMAAVVVCSREFVLRNGLTEQAVEIVDMEVAFNGPSIFQLTKMAADGLYGRRGIRPSEVQVAEIHDCPSPHFMCLMQCLRLHHSQVHYVANTSGGLFSTSSGTAQCTEICLQLRGMAGQRQIPYATVALQHNFGIDGEVVVALFRKGFRCEKVEGSSEKSPLGLPLATRSYSGIVDVKNSLPAEVASLRESKDHNLGEFSSG